MKKANYQISKTGLIYISQGSPSRPEMKGYLRKLGIKVGGLDNKTLIDIYNNNLKIGDADDNPQRD